MTCQSITADYSFKYVKGAEIFSGAKDRILGFTSNMGLGSESSTLTFTIAGKPGNNSFGSPQSSVGRAAIFKCNSFRFGGIIKSLTNSEDGGGNTTKVTMTCAKELLAQFDFSINKSVTSFDSVTARRTDFSGGGSATFINTQLSSVNGTNIHAAIEQNSLGIASRNERTDSAQVDKLLKIGDCQKYGLSNELVVAHGNSTYRAILNAFIQFGAKISTVQGLDVVTVDFTHIQTLANRIPYASTSAYKMSLLDLINSVCDEAGYDFHCTIEDNGWITFKLIDKRTETTFGSVQNIIDEAKSNDKCISSSIGAEFKGTKSARFITGHHLNYIKELTIDTNAKGAIVTQMSGQGATYAYSTDWTMNFDTSKLNNALSISGFGGVANPISISEREFIACGNLDTWKLWGIENNSLSRACLNACNLNVGRAQSFLRNQGSAHYVAKAAVEAVKSLGARSPGAMIYEEICYHFFRNIYESYYGQYYLVIPNGSKTCFQDPTGYVGSEGVFLGEGGAATLMDTPIDSGWPDDESQCIGTTYLSPFWDNSGKLSCFVGIPIGDSLSKGLYNTTFDPSLMNSDYVIDNNFLYTKAQVDGRAYDIDGELGILIKMPSMIPHRPILSSGINSFGLRAISLCLGRGLFGFSNTGGTLNTSYANIFKENVAAGRFTKIALPFKNNQLTYGPWKGGNWNETNGGGVDIHAREDLNPWQYGSYDRMNEAGKNLACAGIGWRTRYESGHVTIAESPAESLGEKNSGEALLASIVVKFDKSGSTTTYNYETYKPKFGNAAENFNTFIKKNVADRRDNYNILKENYHEIIRNHNLAMRQVGQIKERIFKQQVENAAGANSHSSSQIMQLSFPDPFQGQTYGSKNEVGIMKAYDSDMFQDQFNYNRYAAVDLGMLFTPVSTAPHSFMAYMRPVTGPNNQGQSYKMPPYYNPMQPQGSEELSVTSATLNPYSTRTNINSYFSSRGFSHGFQADYCTFGGLNQVLDLDNVKQNFSNVRAAALRGPLMLSSWGYDTMGKPVPNISPGNPQNQFATEWMANPSAWKTGPIDLRWDEKRQVWTTPAQEKIVVAQLIEPLGMGGIAKAILIGNYGNDTEGGAQVPSSPTPLGCSQLIAGAASQFATINVQDLVARPANVGTRIIASHMGGGYYLPLSYIDTFKKTEFMSCKTILTQTGAQPVPDECDQLGLVSAPTKYSVIGYNASAEPVLHDLAEMLGQPMLSAGESTPGETQVLGFNVKDELGQPCMQGFPIVNCEADYPGEDGPNDPLPCPPGYKRNEDGSCGRLIPI